MGRRWLAAAAVAIGVLFTATAAGAAPVAYENTSGAGFGTVDLGSGVFSPIGTTLDGNGRAVQTTGLGLLATGILYSGEYRGNLVYSIDPATGALTTIGAAQIGTRGWVVVGSTLTGLYGVDFQGFLYGFDPISGITTAIGQTGIVQNGTIGISSGSATLYLSHDNAVYSLDTGTGAATLVGATQTAEAFGALVVTGGQLYGGSESGRQVMALTPQAGGTLAASGRHQQTGTAALFYGLAPTQLDASSVPEPAGWALMIVGFGSVGAALRRTARRSDARFTARVRRLAAGELS